MGKSKTGRIKTMAQTKPIYLAILGGQIGNYHTFVSLTLMTIPPKGKSEFNLNRFFSATLYHCDSEGLRTHVHRTKKSYICLKDRCSNFLTSTLRHYDKSELIANSLIVCIVLNKSKGILGTMAIMVWSWSNS